MSGRCLAGQRAWPATARWTSLATLCAALSLAACKRESPPPVRPAPSVQAPPEDPRSFAARVAGLAERWVHADGHLPDCTPLLEKEADRATCLSARTDVSALTSAISRGAPPGEQLPLAATAALSAQRAAQRLRESGVARLFEDRPPAPLPSASSAARAAAPQRKLSLPGAAASARVRSQGSRDLDAISAYARISTLALRDLATYLEFGPLPLRRQALAELQRLAREEPHWAGLRALVNEALLVESDASLKRDLARLREQLG